MKKIAKSKKTTKSAPPPKGAPLTQHREDRTYRVFNFTEDDRQAVLSLGQKSDACPRWQVLESMVQTLEDMDLKAEAKQKTRAARLDMPHVLLSALSKRSSETGITQTRLLVMTAMAYLAGHNGKKVKKTS